jgi:hypothetical protein
MKERISDRYPVAFSILLGILLIFFITIASATAQILKLSDIGMIVAQGTAFLIMAIIITIYMKNKSKSLSTFGFKKIKLLKSKKVLYYIPLLIIALVNPVLGGFNDELTIMHILIIITFAFLVGYTEETIFRGIIKEVLKFKSTAFYIIFSSAFFGILHMGHALAGKNLTSVLLLVTNAFLLGLILALLIVIINNIIPLIAFHFLYDTLAIMTNSSLKERETFVLAILTILYTTYGIYLVFVLKHQHTLSHE